MKTSRRTEKTQAYQILLIVNVFSFIFSSLFICLFIFRCKNQYIIEHFTLVIICIPCLQLILWKTMLTGIFHQRYINITVYQNKKEATILGWYIFSIAQKHQNQYQKGTSFQIQEICLGVVQKQETGQNKQNKNRQSIKSIYMRIKVYKKTTHHNYFI